MRRSRSSTRRARSRSCESSCHIEPGARHYPDRRSEATMTSEREQSRARATQDVSIDHDDAGVGRISRSAQLHAPTSPVVSGLLSRKAERDGNGVAAGAEQAVASAQGSSGSALPDMLM